MESRPHPSSRFRYALERLRRFLSPAVGITPPPTGVRFERDVPVTMRDGAILRVNVLRPETGGPVPVIMSAHPYGKDALPRRKRFGGYAIPLRNRLFRQPDPFSFSAWTSWEAPDPAFWVPRGYAVVNCDLRGFGTSDGEGSLLTLEEARDYHDLIEWAGAQPWSSGKVGLLGVSYLAISQYRVATLHPPHLAAICPWEGLSDFYRDLAYPGGVREDGFIKLWSAMTLKAGRCADNLRQSQMERPLRDAWWQSRTPDLVQITTPMLVCGSFSDHNLHTGGSFRAFMRVSSRHKWLYTHRGGKWSTFYSPEAREAQAAFFDYFLKGENNGMLDTPSVRLEVRETGSRVHAVRHEPGWPLPGTAWTRLHLAPGGRLSEEPASAPATLAIELPASRAVFTHTFTRDTELTGPMSLRLPLALEKGGDCCLFVGVGKVSGGRVIGFEGSYGFGLDRVTTGWLRASHRRLDAAASLPGMPQHDHREAIPLSPGAIEVLDIALRPSATFFRQGDQLRLVIQGRWFEPRNPLFGQFPANYEVSPPCRAILHFGGDFDAALTVPVIPVA